MVIVGLVVRGLAFGWGVMWWTYNGLMVFLFLFGVGLLAFGELEEAMETASYDLERAMYRNCKISCTQTHLVEASLYKHHKVPLMVRRTVATAKPSR